MRDAGVPVLRGAAATRPRTTCRCWSRRRPAVADAACAWSARSTDLADEIAQAAAEAESAFGDATVFVEPYVERGRHVEVQVVGDRARRRARPRRARLLDPAPPPEGGRGGAGPRHRRERRRGDALRGPQGRRGDRLRRRRHRRVPLRPRGRALLLPGDEHPPPGRAPGHRGRHRARPRRAAAPRRRGTRARPRGSGARAGTRSRSGSTPRTLPTTGSRRAGCSPASTSRLDDRVRLPVGTAIRVDSGFETGSEVSTHYDAMLAKVIAWAPSRREAARMLAARSAGARLHGVVTNRDLLVGDPARRDVPLRPGEHRLLRPHVGASSPVRRRRPTASPVVRRRPRAGRARPRRAVGCRPASRSPGATWSPSRSAPCSRTSTARSTSSSGTAAATATPRPTPPSACSPRPPTRSCSR